MLFKWKRRSLSTPKALAFQGIVVSHWPLDCACPVCAVGCPCLYTNQSWTIGSGQEKLLFCQMSYDEIIYVSAR